MQFKLGKNAFGIQVNDRFQQDEVDAVLTYFTESEIVDNKAVNTKDLDSAISLHQCKVEKLQMIKKSMIDKMFV